MLFWVTFRPKIGDFKDSILPYKEQVLGGIGLIAIEVLQLFLYNKSMYNPSLTFRIMVHCSFSYVLTVFPH